MLCIYRHTHTHLQRNVYDVCVYLYRMVCSIQIGCQFPLKNNTVSLGSCPFLRFCLQSQQRDVANGYLEFPDW